MAISRNLSAAKATVFKTGLIARLRLWRTLRAAKIFTARGQTLEAQRTWRRALDIYPGALPARFGLMIASMEARVAQLEIYASASQAAQKAEIEAQVVCLASDVDRLTSRFAMLAGQIKSAADEIQTLHEEVRNAGTETLIARADWQAARRQVVGRLDWLEQQVTAAKADLTAASTSADAVLKPFAAQLEQLGRKEAGLREDVDTIADHLRSVRSLSHVVAKHGEDIAATVHQLGTREIATDSETLANRLDALERALVDLGTHSDQSAKPRPSPLVTTISG